MSSRADIRKSAALVGVIGALSWVTLFAAPAATLDRVDRSLGVPDHGVRARLWMWDAAIRLVRDAPVLGVGLGNYAYWSPRYLGETLEGPVGHARYHNELHADHPHSEPLRILVESGLAGLLFWAWMAARVLSCRGAEWGGLLVLAVFALFNGPLDSPPHALAAVLLSSMLLIRRTPPKPASRAPARLAMAFACGLAFFLVWAEGVPSYRLRAAEDAHLAGLPSFELYQRATSYPWPYAGAHKEYGIALAEAGRDEEAYVEFERALDGLDTGDVYLALAMIAAKQGDAQRAQGWGWECLRRWPSNAEARRLTRE